MGMIVRKPYTMQLPPGAEVAEQDRRRVAHWRLRNGQRRSAEVVEGKDGTVRVRGRSRYYTIRYRDGGGHLVEVATRCKDPVAARRVLADLERQAELVRAGVLSAAEVDAADHAGLPLSKHLDAYVKHLLAKDCAPRRISMLRRRLERLVTECRFSKFSKLSSGPVEAWLVQQAELGMAAATRNG